MQLLININTDTIYIKGVDGEFSFVYYPDTDISTMTGDLSKRSCCESVAKNLLGMIEECR
jgi:hypothetical protein